MAVGGLGRALLGHAGQPSEPRLSTAQPSSPGCAGSGPPAAGPDRPCGFHPHGPGPALTARHRRTG
ncbi:hypothetical protein HMPREF9062_0469 [Actinomyces sp. oral taxon 448 str. F0400]|nr:hypothetical protein HMPREF9062_0469 [Actinomyces sp. oral taxon 448 str. F0400]